MRNLTLADRLFYSTLKVTAYRSGVAISTGTGFFMSFLHEQETGVPAIVTNKHVVRGADQLHVVCHFADGDKPSGKFVNCSIHISLGTCVDHPDASVDLCAVPIGDILNQAQDAGTPIFWQAPDWSMIPTEDQWQDFDAIEEVTMFGCPNGISDQVNNIPIARRGITASPLSNRYSGKDEFLVDMACFPGSSGSPVYVYNNAGYLDRRENSFNLEARLFLVGILYAGPQITNDGQVILAQPPRVIVESMMHLGNVIRASALRVLDGEFSKRFPRPTE
jgi:hypothetical protein